MRRVALLAASLVLLEGSHAQAQGTRSVSGAATGSGPVQDGDTLAAWPGGVEVGAAYIGEAFYNVSGGIRRDGALLHNIDLTVALDGGFSLGIPGFEAFLYLLANAGGSVTDLSGDWQGASNIEAPSAVRLYELWVQQSWREQLSLLVGLYDLNSEFYVSETASLFINSAHGIGPEFAASGINGPSIFPVTSLTGRLRWTPGPAAYAMIAVLDAGPGDNLDEKRFVHLSLSREEGALFASEIGHATESGSRKVALGGWWYTAEFADVSGTDITHHGTYGAYILGETEIRRDAAERPRLAGFARLGYAHPGVHPVAWGWGMGLVYTGLWPGRVDDRMGLSIAGAIHGPGYVRASERANEPVGRSETAIELTYSLPATSWLTIQPDIQYIANPGLTAESGHAVLLGLRVEIGF